MHTDLHVKCPSFLPDFKKTWIFSSDIRKIFKYQISWKSVHWEPSCSMRTDGHYEANSRFSQLCEHALRQTDRQGPCKHPLLFPCTGHCQPIFLVTQKFCREQLSEVILSFKIGTMKSQKTTLKISCLYLASTVLTLFYYSKLMHTIIKS